MVHVLALTLTALLSSPSTCVFAPQVAKVAASASSQSLMPRAARRGDEPRHDAVMGMATYTGGVRGPAGVFVRSLRASGYKGAVVLGVMSDLSAADKAWLERYNVTAKEVRTTKCVSAQAECDATDARIPVALARFRLYKEWLDEGDYNGYVMTSDVRDVFFQADPFRGLQMDRSKPVIQAAREWGWDQPQDLKLKQSGSAIGNNEFNRGWIQGCMGRMAAETVKDEPVLCSGTTLGTQRGMQTYLQLMVGEIKRRMDDGPGCTSYGVDQGFHQFLLHSIRLGKLKADLQIEVPALWNGPLLTIGTLCVPPASRAKSASPPDHSWDEEISRHRDQDGFLLNADGSRAAVVHQIDRCYNQFYASNWLDKQFPERTLELA